MTAEQLFAMPGGEPSELVNGRLRVSEPPGYWHGLLQPRLAAELLTFVRANRLGVVLTESGFVLSREPDTVRAPDVAFVRAERLPELDRGQRYLEGAPDLAVEIVSPGDTAVEVADKVDEYLASGARLVWVVYPRARRAVVWTPDGVGRARSAGDALDGADVVPGFRLALADLFAELPNAEAPPA
jgi:Uma2 family endonuclease